MIKERKVNKLYNIDSTFTSYQQLVDFYERNKDIEFSYIFVSLHKWFAGNMSASLGAILDTLQYNLNTIIFDNIDAPIKLILQKNNFLTYFDFTSLLDNYHTTIPYLKLKPTDGKFFNDYVFNQLLGRNELPKMSIGAKNKIAEAIYEIFVNAQIHSESEYIYTCGQFYPNKDKIEFTIVDVGIGFKNKVNNRFNSKLDAVQAIKWAIKDKNTTKTDISGGIGLALLKEFIDINKGKMQIISGNGFYEYSREREQANFLNSDFPGTVVNLQFKTNDNHSYSLMTELNTNNIF